MPNAPFRFLDSPAALALLGQELAQIGLSVEGAPGEDAAANPYYPARLRFACPWLGEAVEVHWHYSWWPDGINSELARVSVVYQGAVYGEINVEALLRKRLAQPLVERVVEHVAACCAELTSKRQRPAQGRPGTGGAA